VARGWRVTICCARHDRAPGDELRAGVHYRRRGGKTGVYPAALGALALRRLGRVDVVVDVQNGVSFLARLVSRRTLVLVHHVHREQWPVVYGPLVARLGWWIESRLTPWVYRHSPYVAVSEATRHDLATVGVDPERVVVVRNGIEHPPVGRRKPASTPRVCVLGRLVPHKQVEHAIDAVAALRTELPGLHLDVVGDGWWRPHLEESAGRTGVSDIVTFHGTVTESHKHELLSSAWVLALPSLKEGWGLVVQEAALHGVPAIGYRAAGGVAESILDGRTGLLADNPAELTAGLRRLLTDPVLRTRLGTAAQERAATFDWDRTVKEFAAVVEAVAPDRAQMRATQSTPPLAAKRPPARPGRSPNREPRRRSAVWY